MASASIKESVKGSRFLYSIYYYIGSLFISLLRSFVRPQDNLVLFVSYGGKYYDDSPKDIYEAMLEDDRFRDYQFVWAFTNPEKYTIDKGEIIKIDTIHYYRVALKARVWITNVGITRGLKFKGKHTLSVNSWHGSAIKKIGEDSITNDSFKSNDHSRRADIMLAQSEYDRVIYSKAFRLPIEDVKLTGFPRNDSLVRKALPLTIQNIKKEMRIPYDKKVILYAPTYRDYDKTDDNKCFLEPHLNIDEWRRQFGTDSVLIIRAHMAVSKVMGVNDDDFVRDFSFYPSLNDVLLISDVLISDYSGILFDFSILGRPIICYTYDYSLYEEKRGMYMDIRKELFSVDNEDSLIRSVREMDINEMKKITLRFRDKYVQEFGNASTKVLDIIYNMIAN